MQYVQDLLTTYHQRERLALEHARKLSRSQLKAYGHKLGADQGGKCLLCLNQLDFKTVGVRSGVVVDHSHVNGLIRAALCRGCNGALGKIETSAATWGKQGQNNQTAIAAYLIRCGEYLLSTPKSSIYPDHKSDEEKALATKNKALKAAAARAARLKIAKQNKDKV